jgi:hypothetical protein
VTLLRKDALHCLSAEDFSARFLIREIKIDIYGRPLTANEKRQVVFCGQLLAVRSIRQSGHWNWSMNCRSNILNPTSYEKRTRFHVLAIWSRTALKCEDLKCSPIRIGGFEMISHTNKSLLN